jgi:hypothetical protein
MARTQLTAAFDIPDKVQDLAQRRDADGAAACS